MNNKNKLYDVHLEDGSKFQTTYEEGWNILKKQAPDNRVVYLAESKDDINLEDWYFSLQEEFEE